FERLPIRKGLARGLDSGVNIRCRALSNAGNLFTGGRIKSVKEHALCRLLPGAIDKMSELSSVTIQPGQCVLGIFWRRAIVHLQELFSYTHATALDSFVILKIYGGLRPEVTNKSVGVSLPPVCKEHSDP